MPGCGHANSIQVLTRQGTPQDEAPGLHAPVTTEHEESGIVTLQVDWKPGDEPSQEAVREPNQVQLDVVGARLRVQ